MKTVKVCGGHWETTTEEVLAAASAAVVAAAAACNAAAVAATVRQRSARTPFAALGSGRERRRKSPARPTRSVTEEVPCTYTVCKTRQEERTRTVKVCHMEHGRADLQSERLQDPSRRADPHRCKVARWPPEERTCKVNVCKTRQEERTCKVTFARPAKRRRPANTRSATWRANSNRRKCKYTVCKPEETDPQVHGVPHGVPA